jgi:hypothetical protein
MDGEAVAAAQRLLSGDPEESLHLVGPLEEGWGGQPAWALHSARLAKLSASRREGDGTDEVDSIAAPSPPALPPGLRTALDASEWGSDVGAGAGAASDPLSALTSLPSMYVSRAAHGLSSLSYRLSEAGHARSAREVLDVFRAAPPATWHGGSTMRACMLQHNDALLLAHTAARLGALAGGCGADLVAPLLVSAAGSFTTAVAAGRAQVVAAGAGPTLDSAGEGSGARALMAGAEAQASALASLASSWSILPSHACHAALGSVLDTALEALISRILGLEHIDDEAGRVLASLLRVLRRAGEAALPTPAPFVRHWVRAGALADMLEASPREMRAAAVRGGRIDVEGGLSRNEAARLVLALVAEGEERRGLLDVLSQEDHFTAESVQHGCECVTSLLNPC